MSDPDYVIRGLPIIVTKDAKFAEEMSGSGNTPGSVWLLPDDALLIIVPENEKQKDVVVLQDPADFLKNLEDKKL